MNFKPFDVGKWTACTKNIWHFNYDYVVCCWSFQVLNTKCFTKAFHSHTNRGSCHARCCTPYWEQFWLKCLNQEPNKGLGRELDLNSQPEGYYKNYYTPLATGYKSALVALYCHLSIIYFGPTMQVTLGPLCFTFCPVLQWLCKPHKLVLSGGGCLRVVQH